MEFRPHDACEHTTDAPVELVDRVTSRESLTPSADLTELTERMRPSEYTAALLRVIEQRAGARPIHHAIDIGTGSGVLLAGLARQGARELWAVDIDPDSLLLAGALLENAAPGTPIHLLLSDVWHDVPSRTFDAIVANLPHFPADLPPSPGRSAAWSGGGRRVLGAFLDGLAAHLADDGTAWMTHHSLADVALTTRTLAAQGLTTSTVFSWTVFEPAARMAAVAPATLIAAGPGVLHRVGHYHFVESYVLEIRHGRGARAGLPSDPATTE